MAASGSATTGRWVSSRTRASTSARAGARREHEVGGAPVALQPGQADSGMTTRMARCSAQRRRWRQSAWARDRSRVRRSPPAPWPRRRPGCRRRGVGWPPGGPGTPGRGEPPSPPRPGRSGRRARPPDLLRGWIRGPRSDCRAPYHSGMVRIRLFAALREAAGVPRWRPRRPRSRPSSTSSATASRPLRGRPRLLERAGGRRALARPRRRRPRRGELALLPPFSGRLSRPVLARRHRHVATWAASCASC
jgi:hypothetical protein